MIPGLKILTGVVYRIVNQITGKEYFGSTIHYPIRVRSHLLLLRVNKHPNKSLQQDYKMFGENAFRFEILHEMENYSLFKLQYELKQMEEGFRWLSENTYSEVKAYSPGYVKKQIQSA